MRVAVLRDRVAHDESGLTLVELLVTLAIIGILLAIAVPSYLAFERRASTTAAQANLRSALPAVEAYYDRSRDLRRRLDDDRGAPRL